jgi:hypothetical protein
MEKDSQSIGMNKEREKYEETVTGKGEKNYEEVRSRIMKERRKARSG